MASLKLYRIIISMAFHFSLLINHTVKCDEEDNLLLGINRFRASLNLTALTKNASADCLAEEIADLFEDRPCTNTTGPNTLPGTEPKFFDHPTLLAKCHVSNTRATMGVILPVCVPNLFPSALVLSNFTQSRYSSFVNDTKFTVAGVGSEDNWIVVVLTTNTLPPF